jgi:outer membrane receptor protein involved in Fe transport
MEKRNGLLKLTSQISPRTILRTTLMAYDNRWNASGQIPLRDVESGRLARFGSIDPSEGGASSRYSLSTVLQGTVNELRYEVGSYGIFSDLALDSNFTYFLRDSMHGDGIRQLDRRSTFGGHAEVASHHHHGPLTLRTKGGVSVRYDAIKNALLTREGEEALASLLDSRVGQLGMGPYLEEEVGYARLARLRVGARLDGARSTVRDLTSARVSSSEAAIFSPKVSLSLFPHENLDLFASSSRGFHSNDARGLASGSSSQFLVPATTYEFGSSIRLLGVVDLLAAVFRLDIDSEQVFLGDEGVTEPKGASTRHGAEFLVRGAILDLARCDASLALTRAHYKSDPKLVVALAPTQTLSAGCDVSLPSSSYGAFRVRHLGSRPANEDGSVTAPGYTVLSLRFGQKFSIFDVSFDLDNVTNTEYREVQFFTTTRLANETSPISDVQFVPGWPLSARMNVSAAF